jgi:dTMP kinase
MESITARFVSFEGIDGCGKSTLLACLSGWLEAARIPHITTREPGGTAVGERIRDLLLDASFSNMDLRVEVLLYTASRAQHAAQVIRPALEKGLWVLSDRYSDATLAYQGFGRGLDLEVLRRIQIWATHGLTPDHTILVDCDIDLASRRMQKRKEDLDRIELEERAFHERVRDGYLQLARLEPERFLLVDGGRELDAVQEDFRCRFWQPFHNQLLSLA